MRSPVRASTLPDCGGRAMKRTSLPLPPRIYRREFIMLLGGAACVSLPTAQAQQRAVRTIGYLSPRTAEVEKEFLAAFRQGLSETGHVEGRNLAVEYRWAEGRYERLPTFAAELVRRQMSVIATTGGPQPALAARLGQHRRFRSCSRAGAIQ
jgi:putative ABC transport system substrate-binding protein